MDIRTTLGAWNKVGICWTTEDLHAQLQESHSLPFIKHPSYILLSIPQLASPNTASSSAPTSTNVQTPDRATASSQSHHATLRLKVMHISSIGSSASICQPVDVLVHSSGQYLPVTRKAVSGHATPSFVCTVHNSYVSGQQSIRMENRAFSADAEREEDQSSRTVGVIVMFLHYSALCCDIKSDEISKIQAT